MEQGICSSKFGTDRWYKNGVWHREDGPAIIWKNGDKAYYLNGKNIKEEDYLKVLNCSIDELPLYINTDLAPLVKRRLSTSGGKNNS
jgi:hypothetical protein